MNDYGKKTVKARMIDFLFSGPGSWFQGKRIDNGTQSNYLRAANNLVSYGFFIGKCNLGRFVPSGSGL